MASYAKALHTYAVEKGLEVPIFTVDSCLYCAEPEKELERLCSMVDIASELKIPFMRFDIAYKFIGDEPSKSPKKIIETKEASRSIRTAKETVFLDAAVCFVSLEASIEASAPIPAPSKKGRVSANRYLNNT
jgi:hypothetical protein